MNRTGDRGDRGSDRGAQGRGDAGGNAGGFRPRGPVNEEDAEARLGRFYDAIAERYDANNNGKLEVAEIGSERLKGYDGDGDGIVTRAELSKGLTADGPRQREPAGDTDEEDAGESDAEEAPAAKKVELPADVNEKYLAYAKSLVNKYDTNKDGSLTADEWKEMPRPPAAKADVDENGVITVEELARSYLK